MRLRKTRFDSTRREKVAVGLKNLISFKNQSIKIDYSIKKMARRCGVHQDGAEPRQYLREW